MATDGFGAKPNRPTRQPALKRYDVARYFMISCFSEQAREYRVFPKPVQQRA